MEHTAKNFVLQLGSLIALYISLSAIVSVAFGVINLAFPDAAGGSYQYDAAQSQIRFGIALLIVFFPTYIVLTRFVNEARRSSEGRYLTLTKWLIYLSLLIGGAVLLGDLVTVIWTFLNGEITTRFILKALSLLVVIGAAFKYYILDARSYWNTHEQQSKLYAGGTIVIVVIMIVLGFMKIDTPTTIREIKFDEQQVTDLQDMQWRIEEYYRINATLPATLSIVYEGITMPEAPEGRAAYEYSVVSRTSFELCATFTHESSVDSRGYIPTITNGELIKNPNNWDHGTGRVCFDRFLTN